MTQRAPCTSPLLATLLALGLVACGASAPPPAAPESSTGSPEGSPAASTDAPASTAAGDPGNAATSAPKTDSAPTDSPKADGAPKSDAAAAPAAEAGKAPKDDSRSDAAIEQLFKDNRPAFKACYEAARKENKELKGNVKVKVLLDSAGKVKKAWIDLDRSTIKVTTVGDCMVKVAQGIPFPASSKGLEKESGYDFGFNNIQK